MKNLTQKRLKYLLSYDRHTGNLTWINPNKYHKRLAGTTVKCINNRGYITIKIDGKNYLGHRLIWLYMTGRFPLNEVDHIDHCRSNNKWINLRSVTQLENQKNKSKPSNNTSGLTGLSWHKSFKQWEVGIKINQIRIYGGIFKDYFEACCKRKSMENEHGFHQNHGAAPRVAAHKSAEAEK